MPTTHPHPASPRLLSTIRTIAGRIAYSPFPSGSRTDVGRRRAIGFATDEDLFALACGLVVTFLLTNPASAVTNAIWVCQPGECFPRIVLDGAASMILSISTLRLTAWAIHRGHWLCALGMATGLSFTLPSTFAVHSEAAGPFLYVLLVALGATIAWDRTVVNEASDRGT